MATAKEDYERFIRWIHQPDRNVQENVLRFANMILADFARIACTFRQHNSRSNHLAALAQRVLIATPVDAPEVSTEPAAPSWPWKRLHQLTVGPFRGFQREESFDLRKRVLLFYGPNGSGKSSLCEAFEHALLGTVQEAETRRIETQKYYANIHARRFATPRLSAISHEGEEISVVANPHSYRFCFIEKNRIDSFARIAARPPAARTELIATLFGMEQFNDFTSHFNESMDAALVCDAENERALTARRQALVHDQKVVGATSEVLAKLDQDETAFAATCRPGISYAEMKAWIGTSELPGRLQELDGILDLIPPEVVGITRAGLSNRYTAADSAADCFTTAIRQLEERSHQVSFKDMYTAVLALQVTYTDRCPACDTSLSNVTTDPYHKATTGLKTLGDLAALQEEVVRCREKVDEASRALRADLGTVFAAMTPAEQIATPVGCYIGGLPQVPNGERWWQGIYACARADADESDAALLDTILDAAHRLELRDLAIQQRIRERQALVEERERLRTWQHKILERDFARNSAVEGIALAQGRIARFDQDNATLIRRATQERVDIERDRPIKAAYDQFLPYLKRFRNELPGFLMAGLNDLARDLYNEFNYHDSEVDKLSSLHLPLTGEQRIEIALRGDPQRRVDALAVLSEGHIRCLGLAILMAKALSVGCSLIIFDDAINAIDHDHRSGIRQTIFESDRFRSVQIILTCHSNEFVKDIHNSLPHHSRNDWAEYVFRYHDGDHHPRVLNNTLSRNYVEQARAAKNALDDRAALSQGRKALENQCNKVWGWLRFFGRGDLRLRIDAPTSEPALRDLCEALRLKLMDETFQHPEKQSLIDAFGIILGIPKQNLVWVYLNKGTHESADRDDFDANHVDSVIATLERLNDLPLRRTTQS